MYLKYYNLQCAPFGVTPDPRFLYLSPDHKEALGALVYGVRERKGFISIIGEVGTGKTTILKAFLDNIDSKKFTGIYIFNSLASFDLILQEIRPGPSEYKPNGRVKAVQEWLLSEYAKGRKVILIIDDAHRMAVDTLEQLRLLTNLETTQHKLLQIVLAGQPELDGMLERQDLRHLKQRIAVRATLGPLSKIDSLRYIEHRIAKASGNAERIFAKSALKQLVLSANGNPRMLNILCDNALLAGYGYQKKRITAKIANEVIAEFSGPEQQRTPTWKDTLRAAIR